MNPYMSWAILLTVVSGLGWYYTNGSHPKGKTTVNRAPIEKGEASISSKKPKRKTRKSPEPSGSSTPAAKPEEESQSTPTPLAATDSKADEEVDNKDFAMRLSKAKSGTPIVPATKNDPRKKDRRTKKVKLNQQENGTSEVSGSHESNESTRSSSTAGADADDDMSPATSPMMAPASGDVSDMLEGPGDGPSVLRLTGDVKENKKQKQKSQQFKPVETKKQRQQKAKNEAKRLQVEEAEKQRRALLEKQLHTSRDIERRQASQSKPPAPVNNAWATNKVPESSNGAAIAPAVPSADLLDTFTPVSSGKTTNGKAPKAPRVPQPDVQQESSARGSESASASKAKAGNWTDELPSEEEQMRILGAMSSENEWTTVPKKKKKAAKVNGDEVES